MTRNGALLEVTDSRGARVFIGAIILPKEELAAFCSELRPYVTREGVEQTDDLPDVLRAFGG